MPATEEPTPRQRRLIILWALLRALATSTVLVALYYLLPLDTVLSAWSVVLLIVCLVIFAATAIWQVRAITQSERPGLRAIETLAAVVPFYILAFATTYFLTAHSNGATFSEPLSRTGALYFSVTVFATVGFGDITAKTDGARLVVTAQMILDLLLLGLGVRVFVGAVKLGRQKKTPHQPRQPE